MPVGMRYPIRAVWAQPQKPWRASCLSLEGSFDQGLRRLPSGHLLKGLTYTDFPSAALGNDRTTVMTPCVNGRYAAPAL